MNQRSKLNIAVCDDDIFVTEQLSEWIKEYFVSNHLEEPNIYEFDNGEDLIKSEVKYDFVFLDIVIPGMNGINIGRRLLEQNEECLIYIITAYDSYLDAAMSLRVFRYISKPLDKSRIYRNIQDGLKIYTTSNTKILIETKNENIILRATEIIYLEAQGHTLFVNTSEGKYISVRKMDYWEKTLDTMGFFRTHRSFIVNMEHVVRFDHSLVYLDTGVTAYLTKRNYQNFKHAFMMYLEGART